MRFGSLLMDILRTQQLVTIELIKILLSLLIAKIGIDQEAFNECANSGRYDDHIAADVENAVETGGRGTPWSIVIGPDGKTLPLNGAQPQAAIEQIIELVQ